MTRRRYIQNRKPPYNLVEVTDDYVPDSRAGDAALWNDRSYDGLRATDGTDISSRSKQREYMKVNNLTTVDDFKDTWAKAKTAREQYVQQGGSFSRHDIERAISKLQNRR
jgi:hypothetical protein